MKLFPRTLFVLGLTLLALAEARSQTAAASKEPEVSVEFILYSWQSTLPALRYSPRDTTEALTDPFSTTGIHRYAGPATLRFYSTSANLAPDAEPPPPVATVTFPAGASKFMLLAAPAGKNRYLIYAIPQDESSATPPYIRLHNFTKLDLAVGYNEKNVAQVPASSATLIKPEGQATVIRVAHYDNGKWRRLFNNVAELNSDGRQNIILAPDAQRAVTMYTIPEWPKPAAETAPAGSAN